MRKTSLQRHRADKKTTGIGESTIPSDSLGSALELTKSLKRLPTESWSENRLWQQTRKKQNLRPDPG